MHITTTTVAVAAVFTTPSRPPADRPVAAAVVFLFCFCIRWYLCTYIYRECFLFLSFVLPSIVYADKVFNAKLLLNCHVYGRRIWRQHGRGNGTATTAIVSNEMIEWLLFAASHTINIHAHYHHHHHHCRRHSWLRLQTCCSNIECIFHEKQDG